MSSFLYRLGRSCVRRRRLVAVLWVVGVFGLVALAQAAGGEPSDDWELPGLESQHAHDVLGERFPAAAGDSAQVVFTVDDGTLDDPAAAATVEAALAAIAEQPHVVAVTAVQMAPDATIGYADVQYDEDIDGPEDEFAELETVADKATAEGVRTELGGALPTAAMDQEPGGQELVGLAVAVIVLLVAFGSVIAMGLPIGTALLGLTATFGLIGLASAVLDITSAAPVLAVMIGLGVGIDYALFIVTRHREFLHAGRSVEESAALANATAGVAVLFAGATVVIAILGLAIAGIMLVTLMGLMCALAVVVMVAISLTLLPALLGFAGKRIDSIALPGRRTKTGAAHETFWHRCGRHVSQHPWAYLIAGVTVLGVLTLPLFSLRLGMADNGTSPESMTTRRAYDLLAEGFEPGFNGPLLLAAELDDGASASSLDPLVEAIGDDPSVAMVSPAVTSPDGSAAVIRVIPTSAPQDQETSQLVHRLRNDTIPATVTDDVVRVYIGGQTAMFIDLSDKIAQRLPWFIGAVIGLSVILLTVVFRSIAVPLKAAAMNLLSIGAAYGVVVAVFQWGWFGSVFGLEETIPIVSFLPMMMFAILFGLSMDYEVFLLSRIREEYDKGSDNTTAVVDGIASTARVITSAALIMISVFASFAFGSDPSVKLFGLGLAVAVFIDATIVRIVLVPATMRLLGDRNWWLPGWLDRRLPRVDIEGGHALAEVDVRPVEQELVGSGR